MKSFFTGAKDKIFFALMVAVVILCGFGVMSLTSCKTFKPVQVVGQPDECNDYYTTLAYYYSLDSKDSAFVGTVYNECKQAREARRMIEKRNHCKELFYGDALLDKNEHRKYTQFLECVAGKL